MTGSSPRPQPPAPNTSNRRRRVLLECCSSAEPSGNALQDTLVSSKCKSKCPPKVVVKFVPSDEACRKKLLQGTELIVIPD